MAVMLETSRGDLVVDLFIEECPITSKNFLKLCKCAPTPQMSAQECTAGPRLIYACRVQAQVL